MALTLADTDVLIDYLRRVEPSATVVTNAMLAGDLCTTTIARFELLTGVRTASERTSVLTLLRMIPSLTFDNDAAERAARTRQELAARGTPIETADLMIAGIALHHGLPLLTRNRKHFKRVPGLVLADLDAT